MPGPAPTVWTIARIDRLVELHGRQLASGAIATALGVSRNAVMGQISRLRAAGDPRIPAAGVGPVVSGVELRRRHMDALADAFAEGAENLGSAATIAGVSLPRARELWAAIKASLGWQAR